MPELSTPTLEDLRDVPEAAWLWDGARARIVWANREGIAYFGGSSLFDLIDRPFDFQEPGVEQIGTLARSLRRGQVETALLHFPSAGASAPIACRCMIHALADGRPGVLVVARQSPAAQAQNTADDILAAFDILPSAAALITRDGSIRHLNAAALLLLAAGQRASLAGLLGDAPLAEDMLSRIETAGTVVINRQLPVRLGARDIRITARRLKPGGEDHAFALVLLDDVTERRALELKLSEAVKAAPPPQPAAPERSAEPPAALSAEDAEAFEKLGKTLEEGIRHVPRREAPPPAVSALPAARPEPRLVATPAPAPSRAEPPRRKLQALPEQVRVALDSRREALLVAKDGQLLFANPAAAAFFGYRKRKMSSTIR